MSGYAATKAPRKRFGCAGYFLVGIAVVLGWMAVIVLTPYLRTPRQVTVGVFDESQQPIAGATLEFDESEFLTPNRLLGVVGIGYVIQRKRAVTTDANGKAQFGIRFETASSTALSRAGRKLKVVYSQTGDTFRGPGTRLDAARFDGALPTWMSLSGNNGIMNVAYTTTIVVIAEHE